MPSPEVMPRRLKPIVLLSLIVVLILSLALFAGAQSGGGSPGNAVGAAMGQVGKPYAWGTDGPGTFSCVGLVRFALRSVGINDAPWDHYAYLSLYPKVASPQPGDVVVYPDGAAMYIGNGQVVMANEVDQVVGTYPMNTIGTPVGFARPYGGAVDPALAPQQPVADPLMTEQPLAVDPTMAEQPVVDPLVVDPLAVDPLATEQPVADPLMTEQPLAPEPFAAEQPLVEQMPAAEPVATELPAQP
jgi:hypothetical protein